MAGKRPKVKNRTSSTKKGMRSNRKNNMTKTMKGKISSNEAIINLNLFA